MPTDEQIRIRVWKALKELNGQELIKLAVRIRAPSVVLREILKGMAPYIVIEDNRVRIRIVLDEIPTIEKLAWIWTPEKIEYPVPFVNPLVGFVAPREQWWRGTCVGRSAGQLADLFYMALTGDLPTLEDRAQYKKDVRTPDGVLTDTMYPQTHSDEGIYQDSRRIGNVTYPSGSYTWAAAKALLKVGIGWESQWPTSKDPVCVYTQLPTNKAATYYAEAAKHQIEGYGRVRTWEDICAAISKYGAILSSWTIFENYSTMEGGDGTFPSPKGSEIGSHALCLYGYDENYLYCLHSWGSFCQRSGRISREYFAAGFLDGYTILDTKDVKRLSEEFVTVEFSANLRSNWYINGAFIGTTPDQVVKASLRKEETVIVRTEAIEYFNLGQEWAYTPLANTPVYYTHFEVPAPDPEPLTPLHRLIAWLLNRLGGMK